MSKKKENGFNTPFEKLDLRVEKAVKRAAAEKPKDLPPPAPSKDLSFGADPATEADELDDATFFRGEMEGVQPLAVDDIAPRTRETTLPPPPNDDELVVGELDRLVSGEGDFDILWSDEHIEGLAQGIDRRLLKKLRRGDFSRRAHLDLHGKTRKEARPLVQQFLTASRGRGFRCVLIVHGRGLNSKDHVPVLKDSLRVWLTRSGISKSVLAFCSARPADGGLGAVYVLLRR
jgi:DNA-nicking Smr family endonuclease